MKCWEVLLRFLRHNLFLRCSLRVEIPLKFQVLEYSDAPSKANISKALDNASRKGSFTVIIVEN